MNNKLTVGDIFCDLEKAFNCVNRDILLTKLEHYGIVWVFKSLITSYLNKRYQKVVLDNRKTHTSTSSEWDLLIYIMKLKIFVIM
jgi:hypothetical protein